MWLPLALVAALAGAPADTTIRVEVTVHVRVDSARTRLDTVTVPGPVRFIRDTVRDTVTVPGPVRFIRDTIRDTLTLAFYMNTNAAGDSVFYAGPYVWTPAVKPAGFALPLAPPITIRITDTVRTHQWWRPIVMTSYVNPGGFRINWGLSETSGAKPVQVEFPNPGTGTVRVDTVVIRITDTLRLPPVVVTPPTSSREPELPRFMAEMDAMIRSARAADTLSRPDTLYDCTPQGCRCKGPTCATSTAGRVIRP